MPSTFGNTIKLFFLLLLANVCSSSNQRQSYQESDRYQSDRDQSERYQDQRQSYQYQVDQEQDQAQDNTRSQPDRKSELFHVLTSHSQSNKDRSSKSKLKQSNTDYATQILDQSDRDQSNRGNSYKSRSYSHSGNFLSHLLDSRNGPIVVFLTPGTDLDLDLKKSALKSSSTEVAKVPADGIVEENIDEAIYIPPPKENEAYVLYNLLRSTQNEEDLDPDANSIFEETKDILRTAFALRCGARASCEQKCPPKKPECPVNCKKEKKVAKKECVQKCPEKPKVCERKCEKVVEKKVDECEKKVDECEEEEKEEVKCEANCKKIYDELDACQKPKPKPKCGGKTMPPKWLLRLREEGLAK